MPAFIVTVFRKERRAFRIEADSAQSAQDMALSGGELPSEIKVEDEFVLNIREDSH